MSTSQDELPVETRSADESAADFGAESDRLFDRKKMSAPTKLSAIVILLALGIFLLAKAEFRLQHSNLLLYLYGVAVTSVVFVQMYVGMTRYRDPAMATPKTLPPDTDRTPLVSCLVAVHNEEVIIEKCIASLAAQTYPNIEIIIIDDASTDNTPEILKELMQRYPIRLLLLSKNVGKKRALGAGMLRANGDIFAFSDSDSTWAPNAIERTVQVLVNDPEIGAVSGHCRALNGHKNWITKMQDTWYEGQFSIRKAFESVFGSVTCISGPLAVFRRESIFNYIPEWEADRFLGDEFRFATDRTLTGFVLMDAKNANRLKAKHAGSEFAQPDYAPTDWRVVYSKSARAWTEVPDTFKGLLRQQVRWKKSFVRNIFFTGRFYWRRPLPTAIVYYFHVFFVFAGPFVAFRHLVYLPLHGNFESMVLYLFGILLIGTMFGLAYRREDVDYPHRWIYRPLMALLSTTIISWLVIYSLATIKKMSWARG